MVYGIEVAHHAQGPADRAQGEQRQVLPAIGEAFMGPCHGDARHDHGNEVAEEGFFDGRDVACEPDEYIHERKAETGCDQTQDPFLFV